MGNVMDLMSYQGNEIPAHRYQYRDGSIWKNLFDGPLLKEEWLTEGPYSMYDNMRVKVWLSDGRVLIIVNGCDNDGWRVEEHLLSSGHEYPKPKYEEFEFEGIFIPHQDILSDWNKIRFYGGKEYPVKKELVYKNGKIYRVTITAEPETYGSGKGLDENDGVFNWI